MQISVITPSYNMLAYIKRCRASVADQQGVEVEHIVADGGSNDGTPAWLASAATPIEPQRPQPVPGSSFRYFSGRDAGMYDALNKGFDTASGEVVAWLNCDEQYLEGTLARVREVFAADPKLDVLFGGALLVRPDGSLLAARKPYPARYAYIATSHLYNLSCGMFFRRRIWQGDLRFDTRFRNLGDHDLVLRMLKKGLRTRTLAMPLSAFAFTGGNLSWSEGAQREAVQLRNEAPAWARALRLPLNALRVTEKLLNGAYTHGPVDYALYEGDGSGARRRFHVEKVSTKWPDEK
ncbi:MAG: glycosyltransferase [Flavobacteriales bacterium]|nr:glycosyltransferase [Flavobacteriales bacterium]